MCETIMPILGIQHNFTTTGLIDFLYFSLNSMRHNWSFFRNDTLLLLTAVMFMYFNQKHYAKTNI